MHSVSLVIPAYNEEEALPRTFERCLHTLQQCTSDYEIVMLDDCSCDGTWPVMQELCRRDPARIRALRHPENRGIAVTFEDLYRAAGKEFVFLIPADGEYPPEALGQCMPLMDRGADIVICTRNTKHYTLYRQCISRAYRHLTTFLFGVDLRDPGSIKCVRRSVMTDVPVRSTSVYVEVERIIRALRSGYRYSVIPIQVDTRKSGQARGARFSTVMKAVRDLFSLWWEMGYQKVPSGVLIP